VASKDGQPGSIDSSPTVRSLERALEISRAFIESRADRAVWPTATLEQLRASLGGELPSHPIDPTDVIDALARAAEPGIVTTTGPRYFGFVTGGALPATVAAEWLTAVWDQPASLYVLSPAAAVVEEVAARWLLDLLGLPAGASVGFVTGCHMANFTALAAARHELLRRAGWDVEADGLQGAPRLRVIVGDEVHVSVIGALRLLGIGSKQVVRAAADDQGRMRPDALAAALAAGEGPTIVCAQAGNVNSGAFDPLDAIAELTSRYGAWLHVDGAFGLWAAASRALKTHVREVERADSWATDAHKWLNVPYDSGLVFIRHPEAHRAAMSLSAAYLVRSDNDPREGMDWTPESSRRARGFAVYAALRSLGRSGVEDLVDRCCRLARRFADRLREEPSIQILNDVVLNQVLVRVVPATGDADVATRDALRRIQDERICWLGGSRWHGLDAMRISVSNWSTTEEDIDRSADSILRAVRSRLTRAREEDAGRIAELHLASWRATYTGELSQAFHDSQDAAAWAAEWRGQLADGVMVILAKGADRLDGFAACGPVRGKAPNPVEWEIYNIHVDPARRGGGLGGMLFNAAAELGRQRGARQLVLWVVGTNNPARRFYEARGMQCDGGEQEHVLGHETLHEVRYRMDL